LTIVPSLWIFLSKIHVGFLAGVHVFPCSVLLDHTLTIFSKTFDATDRQLTGL
jgi:hypothetical protein